MTAALYGWVKNILFFLIAMSLLETLLPSKAYGRFIRFFAGIVLLLTAAQPLLGGLGLDAAVREYFEQFRFQMEANQLREEISGMEKERIQKIMADYEEAAAREVKRIVREEGLAPAAVRVEIEKEETDAAYGTVTWVGITVEAPGTMKVGEDDQNGSHPSGAAGLVEPAESVEPVMVLVEPVKLAGSGRQERNASESGASGPASESEEAAEIPGADELRRKVAIYYGLEPEDVDIQLEGR